MNKKIKTGLIAAAIALTCSSSKAVTVFGKEVVFKSGAKEWSEPIVDSMNTETMEKKGIPAIPIQVRVRVVKKIVWGCRYEVEVTNLDPSRRLSYEMDALAGQERKKHKLKPGEKEVYLSDSYLGKKNCPSVEDCATGTCEYALRFFDVSVK